MFSKRSDEWETPQNFFDDLNNIYHFTLDPCCQTYNAKCEKYYTREDNGLTKDWAGETVFCNPPYGSQIGNWVKKCYEESLKGVKILMLIPARVDTRWFHNYIYNKPNIRIEFIKGRLKFINGLELYKKEPFKPSSAPFPSMLVYFNL